MRGNGYTNNTINIIIIITLIHTYYMVEIAYCCSTIHERQRFPRL